MLVVECSESFFKAVHHRDMEEKKSFNAPVIYFSDYSQCLLNTLPGGSHKCDDARVQQCLRKIYRVGGAIDSTKQRTEKERW